MRQDQYCDGIASWLKKTEVAEHGEELISMAIMTYLREKGLEITKCPELSTSTDALQGGEDGGARPDPNDEEFDDGCEICHATMSLRDGCDPTPICDNCAQEIAAKVRATDGGARELEQLIDEIDGYYQTHLYESVANRKAWLRAAVDRRKR